MIILVVLGIIVLALTVDYYLDKKFSLALKMYKHLNALLRGDVEPTVVKDEEPVWPDRQIIVSKMITPDGTVLHSRYRHDFLTHEDKNGKHYMLDGGTDYVRCSVNGDEELVTLYEGHPHNETREHFKWGTRGKNGDEPLRFVKLKDMSTKHIQAVIETQHHIPERYKKVFSDELYYRVVNGIYIED